MNSSAAVASIDTAPAPRAPQDCVPQDWTRLADGILEFAQDVARGHVF